MQTNRFNKYTKLYQIIIAAVMLGCVSAYAEEPVMLVDNSKVSTNTSEVGGTCYNDDGSLMLEWVLTKQSAHRHNSVQMYYYTILTRSNYTDWADTTKSIIKHHYEPYSQFSVNGKSHTYQVEVSALSTDHQFTVKVFENNTLSHQPLHTLNPRCVVRHIAQN
ncbi:MAG TPA: hypothetical protein VKR58_00160 [Aquella sp.]|nr:hypothetical protein [Aquella sp.]